jgi:uncharacterized secreted protein with C-terminal beta-propeller domain
MPSETTNIFRFSLADGGVAFASQGTVPGHILNQFSMDEYGETFRIATSVGHLARMANENTSSNNLYVLNRALETVGSIEDIAPGESIYSVRFMGDRTYMVTFKKVDPLFVIDTSDPRNPKILGKLKIPGYSDYLHPYDATHLIGFGKDAVDAAEGDFAWYQGMKIALFDVSDVSNPKELYSTVIGDRGTSSPLLSNHKALLFDKTRNLLAFPVTVYELTDAQKSASSRTGNEYGSPVFQGAYVYDLTIAGGFKKLGTITHYADDSTFMKSGSYWYGGVSDISRILRIQDSLLTVSQDQVKSTSWPGMKEEGSVKVQ